jgi:starvation-inducible outer membrane lipoprotein
MHMSLVQIGAIYRLHKGESMNYKRVLALMIVLLLIGCTAPPKLTDKESPAAVENICDNSANKGTVICP